MSINKPAAAADLMIFARVVEAGSFSAAALRLGLPKSSVSRRVAAFEARLGERVFERSTRRLALTDLGRSLIDHGRRLIEAVDAVDAVAEQRRAQPTGVLRVSMPGDFVMLTLPRLLAGFSRRHPAVDVQLDLSPRRVDLLAEGFDLAVRMGALPEDASLVARRLVDFETGLVASPDYLARRGAPLVPSDLPGHDAVALLTRDGQPFAWELRCGDERWEGHIGGRLAANSMGALVQLAAAGAGIAAVSLHYALEPLERGHLVRVLPAWSMPAVPAWAVMPTNRLIPPKTRVFVDALRRFLARQLADGAAPPAG
ncbi:MAG: LysR family transcriptional regulator [Rhodocyclaceae bacterium]|nr:LysR family transcriptional regulator [Rhodocyclaceae bacterium]